MMAKAVIFDLHHTLTETRESPNSLTRKIAADFGIDMNHLSDEEMHKAWIKADQWLIDYTIENNVNIHWGSYPEDFIEANRIAFDVMNIQGLSNQDILEFEKRWKYMIRESDWEYFTKDAILTVRELDKNGFMLAVCTRRYDDPYPLLKREGLSHLFSSIHWSGVPGYAKPSPYTLLMAARELGMNPKTCIYVGNIVDLDIIAARRAQMQPILTSWANPEEIDKAPTGIEIIESPLNLLDLLE